MDNPFRRRALLGLAAWPLVLASGQASGASTACPALLDRSIPRLQDEQAQALCQYSGKVLLIVNTASACGYTSQYEGLQKLHEQYRERGLVVMGLPSNDFAGQESGDNRQIAEFCENQFAVRFPMFVKGAVRGPQAQPLYADLKRLSGQAPGWNFHKYLVGRDGRSVRSYASAVGPDDRRLRLDIETFLNAR